MAKKEKPSALGKGLSSIFGAEVEDVEAFIGSIENGSVDAGQKQVEIELTKIRPNPYQPRKTFDEKALKELAESIKEHGIFTPILVRKSVQGYEIIAGERRHRAAKLAGLTKVPCMVVEFNDTQMMEIALLENIQRENLNPIEEALAYQNLIQRLGYTQEQLAQRVGKSREYIANLMRLLKLPLPVQELVVKGKLTT
ncbi:MAG: ParB/RepB/Spo0J family partition protein, partial [Erysipelotrichaceae bacterium]|nr:ParB/RepB/Spo0J family partition protein [Erysipelotrichaceae bacterium]